MQLWASTLVTLGVLLVLAWRVGASFGYSIFAVPSLTLRDVLAALAALAVLLGLRVVAQRIRSKAERRTLAVYRMAPRTGREWMVWSATVVVAGVAEEAAYRGVGMSILWYAFGSPWPAVAICATAFALAHWVQGWKSAAVIFAMALVAHALVAITGTLVLMMIVHAVYDFIAGARIAKQARIYDLETPQP
jgi:membrane protease YdiL (CAAX protease family)